ncbi:MAG: ArnT family glycosyltransferase, partial [Vicinamibacterales bacterium]
ASYLTFFAGLGRAAISDSDEGFYAEAAREMVESSDWLTPHFNYEERFEKPILYYWLAAGAFSVVGPSEIGARLPAATSGLLLVLVTWWCGRRWAGERVGFIAGVITATNFGYSVLGRLALPDLPLALCMTCTTWMGLESARLSDSTRPAVSARPWLLGAAAAAGLGFLMKGPVAVAIPGLTILMASRLGLVGRARWLPCRLGDTLLAAALFAAVAVPWFAAMSAEHGVAYLQRFFVAENVERFATDRYNEPRSFFFYIPVLLGGLVPWTPLLALWMRRSVAAPTLLEKVPPRLLVIWAAVPFVFYSLSIGKQPRYILPVLPPLALLLARSLAASVPIDPRERSTWLAWTGTACGGLLMVIGVLLLRVTPLLIGAQAEALWATAGAIVASGALVVATAWWRPRRLIEVLATASVVALVGVQYSIYSSRGSDPVEQMAAAYAREHIGGETTGTYRVFVRNLVFYTRTAQRDLPNFEDLVAFLQRDDRVLCVLRQRDLDRIRAETALTPRVLQALPYFNPAGLRVDALLWPNPTRDLDTVYLISNR